MIVVAPPQAGRRAGVLASLSGIVTGARDTVVRFRRASWRRSVETILMSEHGWPLESAMNYADTMEEIADGLIAEGKLDRLPSPREVVGKHAGAAR